jgi:hypothetical protein
MARCGSIVVKLDGSQAHGLRGLYIVPLVILMGGGWWACCCGGYAPDEARGGEDEESTYGKFPALRSAYELFILSLRFHEPTLDVASVKLRGT